MAETNTGDDAGGFERTLTLPSPAPSTSTTRPSNLPKPRAHPLRPGSAKEDQVRNYVSERMLHISRRFVKKFGVPEPGDEIHGYKTFADLCSDLESLINIIWLSGTPSLQIPYLLNVASEFNTWLSSFPPSPVATFSVLHKLDHCFASLLTGQDIETKEPLPGFENGLRAGMSRTDMVRCKSMAESTRVLAVEVMSQEHEEEEQDDEEPGQLLTADESESGHESPGQLRPVWREEGDEELLHMDVARVYENTLVQLGETLGNRLGETVQISDD